VAVEFDIDCDADGVACIRLAGRMDIEGTQEVELRLVTHTAVDHGRFIIDLADVSFLASMGIRALIVVAKNVRARGGRLALCAPNQQVATTLETAGLPALVPLCTDRVEAHRMLIAQ